MLNAAEIALLLRTHPDRRAWTVLDVRRPERPSAWAVFVRAWAVNGFVLRPLPEVSFVAQELRDHLAGQGPLLLTGPTPPDDLLTALDGLPGTVVVTDRDGRLFRG